jgi:hypothetical protein
MSPVTCALCRSPATLRESHILPKFMVRWIQETSATGKLRNAGNVRRRHQDGAKRQLLCGPCEQRFSGHERWFAESVFRPKVEGKDTRPPLHHTNLLPFVVSIAWRTAQVDAERLALRYPRHAKGIRRAVEAWRCFLTDSSLPSGNHYFLALPDQVLAPDGPERLNWYLHRSLDLTALLVEHRPFIWWKAPGFAGLSPLGGHTLPGGQGHRVSVGGAAPDFWAQHAPDIVVKLLLARARDVGQRIRDIPETQLQTIEKDYRKNFDEWLEGPAAAVAHADHWNRFEHETEGQP